jgi:FkbM family methyltransferase
VDHIALNDLDDRVDIIRTALGQTPGFVTIRSARPGVRDWGRRSVTGTGPSVEDVAVTTLDLWAETVGVDQVHIVKIDVEGAEVDVLRGMRRTIARRPPLAFVVEMNDGPEISKLLPGYTGWWIRARGLHRIENPSERAGNALFIRSVK